MKTSAGRKFGIRNSEFGILFSCSIAFNFHREKKSFDSTLALTPEKGKKKISREIFYIVAYYVYI